MVTIWRGILRFNLRSVRHYWFCTQRQKNVVTRVISDFYVDIKDSLLATMTLRCCRFLVFWLLVQTVLHLSDAFIVQNQLTREIRASLSPLFMSSQQQPRKKKTRAMYPFQEARKIARGHGFESKQEFLEYDCAGAYQLPKNADEVWREDWTDWDDFLGIPLNFEQGREVARTLQLQSQEEYLKMIESKTISEDEIASRLPYRPDLKHKQEWKSWEDWLGTTK